MIHRFGADNVQTIQPQSGEMPMLQIALEKRSKIHILMTNGLSGYTMPVPEKFDGREYNELYFCLPSYWDLESPNGKWVIEWLQKLAKHVVEKRTWFGPGHTIPNGNPVGPLSATMKEKYLMLSEPMFLNTELIPLELDEKTIHFLSVIPIFEDEMDYKMGKGTYKLLRKMEGKGITELLDDYRLSSLKSKWRVFGN